MIPVNHESGGKLLMVSENFHISVETAIGMKVRL